MKYLLIFIFAFISNSCKTDNKQQSSLADKAISKDSINKKLLIDLATKYNALNFMDTSLNFTYQIQNVFLNKNIVFEGFISDLINVDSGYILKITGFSFKQCMADLFISKQLFILLDENIKDTTLSYQGCFIFKPTTITPLSPEIRAVPDTYNTSSAHLDISDDDILIFMKGQLTDFVIYKKK